MPPTVVDATVATPGHRRRGPAALPNANANANAGCVVATALSDANANAGAAARRPKAKTVASRYLTPSSKSPAPRTPASTDRSRPVLLPNVAAAAAATDGSATTTRRTLAVAFQSPAYSLETGSSRASSSASASPVAEPAAATPEPKRSTARAKVSDASQNTYRALTKAKTPECTASSKKEAIAAIFGAVRSTAFRGPPRRASVDGANEYLLALSSDTDSASSGGSGSGDGGAARRSVSSGPGPSPAPRSAMSSSAQFTRDGNGMGTRSERFAYSVMPSPSRAPTTSAPVKKRSLFTGLLSSPFSKASLKQTSPSKPVASAFRRTASPTPARRSTEVPASAGNTLFKASSGGCGVDGDMKFKLPVPAAIKSEDEHQLRLLYTRELQWRLVNAQLGAAISSQTMGAEKKLCGAWISILRMRKSVAIRKMQLQLLRNNCKLMAILRGQMQYLEEWSFLERDHAHSLSGTTQALTATVLRLPVSNGAMADIQGIRNALSSAVDVMHTIGNSTRIHLPKLARTNVLVSQLSRVFIQEHILITQCRDLLSTLASMHVTYSSLQGQRIQLNQTRPHFQ
ncbi:hypothetical protein BDA96_02G011600 [Sorghum bicolor]|uniref:Protein SNOWY COTYLEDON 3 n=2 Tax=Sorghum bicolor TaxID=4558 RepID=A0A921RLQ3_SORBI|nr:QWRF motif-containing protein 2 [Sorghum bicolor]EER95762.2 hypothetical protein SORBI_3002G011000 [Sorghum bicolor]KAG0541380.1 hypothetical protein BDA96_02G011600 [Sorghum bicolor]|eukprot:XP_021308109.1 QWRF motif-containing protein 2 [Sorghum bicolor]